MIPIESGIPQISIPNRLIEVAKKQPSNIFCHFIDDKTETSISYEQLMGDIQKFIRLYHTYDIKPGQTIVIMLPHHQYVYAAFLATMWIGALPTLMPVINVKQQTEYFWLSHIEVFKRVGVTLIVVTEDNINTISRHIPNTIKICAIPEKFPVLNKKSIIVEPVSAPDDLAFIQHSSGTTGVKKGVALTHSAIFAQLTAYSKSLEMNEAPCIASWLPLYHDMGLITSFILPLLCGGKVVFMDALSWVREPTILLDYIEKYHCTHAWLPNFAFQHISNNIHADQSWNLSSLKQLINCSEPCQSKSFNNFNQALKASKFSKKSLRTCYAMAETVFAITQSKAIPDISDHLDVHENENNILSSGFPIDGIKIDIVDDDGNSIKNSDLGEIRIQSPFLFSSYLALPYETKQRLRNNWYYTRDLGYLYKGELYVIGRIDDLLIVRGQKFFAHKLESICNQVQGVIPGRVIAIEMSDKNLGTNKIIILVETTNNVEPLIIKRTIKNNIELAYGFLVNKVEIMPPGWLAKTTSGKISRKLNLKRYHQYTRNMEKNQ